jgi:single-stranded DNA-binding protein
MAEYATANGFVQFDPVEREANGQNIIDFTIKTPGTDGILIRVTAWPELQTPTVLGVEKGDFLAVDGKLTIGEYTKDGESRKSVQINANQIAVLKGEQKAERETVNEPTEPASEALF